MTVGPTLTRTDVAQRLHAFWEEPWAEYPNEDLETGCLALYEGEKAQGTDANTAAECLSARIALEAYPAIRKTPEIFGRKSYRFARRLFSRGILQRAYTTLSGRPAGRVTQLAHNI
jgi:hypothetical protein